MVYLNPRNSVLFPEHVESTSPVVDGMSGDCRTPQDMSLTWAPEIQNIADINFVREMCFLYDIDLCSSSWSRRLRNTVCHGG